MKESEKIREKCRKLQEELNECYVQATRRAILDDVENIPLGSINVAWSSLSNRGKNTMRQVSSSGETSGVNKDKMMLRRIPKIENSFERLKNYPSVTERYYQKLYFLHNSGSQLEHHCVLVHSNKICLIALAPTHPVVKEKKKISKLDFQVTNKLDRLENKVTGKGKKGGQHIMPDSTLCFVECEDGAKYTIWGCIKGKLVEINQSLLKDPNIISEKPLSQGFVAIICPSVKDMDSYRSRLLTQENYENQVLSCCA